jgi:hypothetical protein
MFPLARPYRQVLATFILIVTAVLPTSYVVVTAWKISRPGHLRDVEVELSRQLGLQVSLEGIRYPCPGEVVYRGIVFRQEEPRRKGLTEIARARSVRLHRGDRELMVETDGLRLRGESPKLAMAQLGLLLQRPSDASFDRVNLSAPTCDLDFDADNLHFTLRDVAGMFQTDRVAPTVKASYRMVAKGSNTRCELTLTRDRKTEPVRTTLAIKTMDGLPLPCQVLDVFFDSADWLGQSARVEGALTLRQTGAKDWEADFQGDLHDVDLGTLVGRRFPSHRLSGLAHVAIKSARWGDRPGQGLGWVDADGEITTGHGSMGAGLLNALAAEMNFRVPDKAAKLGGRKEDVEFHAMGLTFEIRPDGEIRLGGALGNEFAPDVVLARQTSALAYAPRGAANVRGLIKTLVPTNASDPVMVPLTRESRVLLCFPAPPQLVPKRLEGN